jgi:hypothetical protein
MLSGIVSGADQIYEGIVEPLEAPGKFGCLRLCAKLCQLIGFQSPVRYYQAFL